MKRITALLSVLLILSLCLILAACDNSAKIKKATCDYGTLLAEVEFSGNAESAKVRIEFENHDPEALDGTVIYTFDSESNQQNQIFMAVFSIGSHEFSPVDSSVKYKGSKVDGTLLMPNYPVLQDLKEFFGKDVKARCIVLMDNKEVASQDVIFE